MIEDNELNNLYEKYLKFTSVMVEENDPLAVAAIMMAQSLSMYRTALDEEDYNKMVDNISSNRGKVHRFTPGILQ